MFTLLSDRPAHRDRTSAFGRLLAGSLLTLLAVAGIVGLAHAGTAANVARERLNAAERKIRAAEHRLAAVDSEAASAETLIVATRKARGPVTVDLGRRGTLQIDPDSDDGDKVMIGESLVIEKDQIVEGDAVSLGGSVTVYGHVLGDVVSVGGSVELGDSALVGGDAVSVGGGVRKSSTAIVGGETVQVGISGPLSGWFSKNVPGHIEENKPQRHVFGLVKWLVFYLILFAFAALSLVLARDRIGFASNYLSREPLPALLLGISSPVLVLIAFVLLCITLVGIPVGLLLLLLYPAFVFLGWVVAGHRIGLAVRQERELSPVQTVFGGLLVLTGLHLLRVVLKAFGMGGFFVGLLGFAGFMVSFVAALAGLGAIIGTRFRRGPATPMMPPVAQMPPGMAPPPPVPPMSPGPTFGS